MKFKGQTVKGTKREYLLKQQLSQGGFSVIYSTSDPQSICKVQVLSNPQILRAYRNQKQALQQLQHRNIVELKDAFQLKQKDDSFGFLILQNCSKGNGFNILQSHGQMDVPQKLVLDIFYYVTCALEYMHQNQVAHRDIKLQNVLLNAKGQYKLCDFGSSSKQLIRNFTKQNRGDIQQYIQKTTTPLYRSPEQLDLYSGYQIGTKVDIFALGVFVFMLCFKKQPFESRLSAINKQYFVPEQTSYSSELISLIQRCFATSPRQRLTAKQLKREVGSLMGRKVAQIDLNLQKQLDNTLYQLQKINDQMLNKSTQVAQCSIFDKIKRIYNQITTQTQGWILTFIQDNEQAPPIKYNRSIISKCWQKRYKVQKMYQILFKYSQEYKGKSLMNLKLLILVHNFLRKGPPQSINHDSKFSPNKLCTKIYRNWKLSQRSTDSQDIKRNSYLCLVIRYYSLVLTAKWKLCLENSQLIQGNFSILPFLQSSKEVALLKLPFIIDLMRFLETCTRFHEIVATRSYLLQVQRTIILSLVDQEYCCVSLLVFLISALKQAICHLNQDLDMEKLSLSFTAVQRDFQDLFKRLTKLFQSANKLTSSFQQNTPILLNPRILDRIKGINIRQRKPGTFQFKKHINYQRNIEGLKIPVSYEEAVKNPNFLKSLQIKDDGNAVQMDQFKIKKNTQLNKYQQPNKQDEINNATQSLSGQSFKKNKQNKTSKNQTNSQQNKNQSKRTKSGQQVQNRPFLMQASNISQSSKNAHLMQFTHQNLNKDMNSGNKKIQQTKVNQFKDFLSIADEKCVKQNGRKGEKNVPKVQGKHEFLTSSNNVVDVDIKSKISSVNSINYDRENNAFQQPPQPTFSKSNKDFNLFNNTKSNRQQNKPQNQPANKPPQKSVQKQLQTNNPNTDKSVYNQFQPAISSLSKQVYNTLNKKVEQQNNKVLLMSFFDDEQQQQPVGKEQSSSVSQFRPPRCEQVHLVGENLLNRTSPEGFGRQNGRQTRGSNRQLNHNNGSKDNNSSRDLGKSSIQEFGKSSSRESDVDDRYFKTMPADHSFVDLKGFAVGQVERNADQYFIQFSALKFLGKVGFGHSSQVFKGQWRGRQVAIKRIKEDMSPSNAKQFKREIMTSVKIRHHPNLVTLIGIAQYKKQYYIVSEFCNGVTLFDFLHESDHSISIKAKVSIAMQIATGMLFLHTNEPPIIHRDLKSLNVLLVNKYNGQSQPQIKIADFGLSTDLASTHMTGTLGTYYWMAPQTFNNQPYLLKADVYSYGIVLWQILSQSPPYTNIKNPQSLMKYIALQNGRPDMSLICADCPYQMKMLMIRCWDRFPQNRPNFKQILQTLNNIRVD